MQPPPSDAPGASLEEKFLLLGEATYLFMNSPVHRTYPVHQLLSFVLTPLRLGQARMYRSAKGPVGFVAWAYLTVEASESYSRGRRVLLPEDWNAGDQLWFVEFVAPFGHGPRIVEDLRRNVFPFSQARSLHRHSDGRPPKVVHWRGVEFSADAGMRIGASSVDVAATAIQHEAGSMLGGLA